MKRLNKIKFAIYLAALPLLCFYPLKKILDFERPAAPPQKIFFAVEIDGNKFTVSEKSGAASDLPRGYAILNVDSKTCGKVARVVKYRRHIPEESLFIPVQRITDGKITLLEGKLRPEWENIPGKKYVIGVFIYPSGDCKIDSYLPADKSLSTIF